MKKKLSLSEAKERTWKAFSLYIRLKDADPQGMVICYTCDNKYHYKKVNAGHGIAGRTNSILFEEKIVRPQCVGCNMWGGGKYGVFTRKLIDELGFKEYDVMVTQSRQTRKFTVDELLELEEKYKTLTDSLHRVII